MSDKLSEIINDQLIEARAKAGQKIIRKLGRGLRIEMTCINSNVWLAVTRDDKFPSLQEWETVKSHFPYELPKAEPTSDREGSRYSIRARFALPRAAQLKLM